ncbi:MAG: hypothetical protein WCJ85_09460 [Chitinophagaceae bacterium]
MKKILAALGSLLIFAGLKAQTTTATKEVKPVAKNEQTVVPINQAALGNGGKVVKLTEKALQVKIYKPQNGIKDPNKPNDSNAIKDANIKALKTTGTIKSVGTNPIIKY